MRGLLKSKSPLNHFLLLVSIALASLFIIGFVGTLVLSKITGIDIVTMSDSSKWKYNDGNVVTMIRGMQIIQFVSLFYFPVFYVPVYSVPILKNTLDCDSLPTADILLLLLQ